jgi:5-methylcytosine-specific restriction protein A
LLNPHALSYDELARPTSGYNGVAMKLSNFQRLDPNYSGTGLEHGSRLAQEVWLEFAHDHDRLAAVALTIRTLMEMPSPGEPELFLSDDDEVPEGRLLARLHRLRVRNRSLVRRKKEAALRDFGTLACEVCSFDFAKHYGELGEGFIECHHTVPLGQLTVDHVTKLRDLALVCANCHRMLHRGPRWRSVLELRSIILSARMIATTG